MKRKNIFLNYTKFILILNSLEKTNDFDITK